MKDKGLKCNKCNYMFNTDSSGTIQCPYCKNQGNLDDFEVLNYEIGKDGYARALSEFQSLLEQGEKKTLKSFFRNEVKNFSLEYEEGITLKNKKGEVVDVEEIHDYIQKDVILQRKLYNIWMDYYR